MKTLTTPSGDKELSDDQRRENLLKTYEVLASSFEAESALFWSRWSHLLAANGILATVVAGLLAWHGRSLPFVLICALGVFVSYVWMVSAVRATVNTYATAEHARHLECQLGMGPNGMFTSREKVLECWRAGKACLQQTHGKLPDSDWLYSCFWASLIPTQLRRGVRRLTAAAVPFGFVIVWVMLGLVALT